MTSTTAPEKPIQGSRWQLRHVVDRGHFTAPAGAKGTVATVEDGLIALRMDDEIPGAEEWDNEIEWTVNTDPDFLATFLADCEAQPLVYTLHPFGDEWLWDEQDNSKPKQVTWAKAVEVAQAQRASYQQDADTEMHEWAAGMWFTLMAFDPSDPEQVPPRLSGLISPDGKLLEGDEAIAMYERIGSDGEWPKG